MPTRSPPLPLPSIIMDRPCPMSAPRQALPWRCTDRTGFDKSSVARCLRDIETKRASSCLYLKAVRKSTPPMYEILGHPFQHELQHLASFVTTEGLMTGMKQGSERDSLALDTHSFHVLGSWGIMKGLINTEHCMYQERYITFLISERKSFYLNHESQWLAT